MSHKEMLVRVAKKRGYTPEEYTARIRAISSGKRVCAHSKTGMKA